MTSVSARLEAAVPLRRALALVTGRHWVTVGAFALVAGTGFASGGYFPESWGWPTLGAAWAAGLAVVGRRERNALSRTATAAAGLLVALTAWTLLGVVWSIDVTQTVLEAERTAVYAAALLAALLWAGKRPERLLHGTWAGISAICAWALLTRLVPDHFGAVIPIASYRISLPIGYWNSLGLLAGMGALLALGLAARAQTKLGRATAAFTLPALVTTCYFTFGRGAWIALFVGVVATFALERHQLHLSAVFVALLPWTTLAIYWASGREALKNAGPTVAAMAPEGHSLLLELLALGAVSAIVAAAIAPLEPKLVLPHRLVPFAAAATALVLVAGAAAIAVEFGSPSTIARRAWHDFSSAPLPQGPGRITSLAGNGRVTLWKVGWHQAQAYPVLGSGAGTYESYWRLHRPADAQNRDAHSLYLETLAELGPPGLALLALLFALPAVAAFRGRRKPLASAAFGAYVAYAVHVIADWDWEIATTTLAFLLCGAMLLSAPRRERRTRRPAARYAALALSLVLGATGLYTIASRLPLQRLSSQTASGSWNAARNSADRASALAPWSSEPWIQLGEAELNAGRTDEAAVAFRKAVAAAPGEWLPWHDLARATTGAEQARAHARAVALNPFDD